MSMILHYFLSVIKSYIRGMHLYIIRIYYELSQYLKIKYLNLLSPRLGIKLLIQRIQILIYYKLKF